MIQSDNDPVDDRENYKFGLFYYNPDDDRTFIRIPGSANRYITNYGDWTVYIVIVPLVVIVCYAVIDGFFFSP